MIIRSINGDLILNSVEEGQFKLVRIRKEQFCYKCDKLIASGSYMVGRYGKICIGCVDEYFKNYIIGLESIKGRCEKVMIDCKNDKVIKNNVVKSL